MELAQLGKDKIRWMGGWKEEERERERERERGREKDKEKEREREAERDKERRDGDIIVTIPSTLNEAQFMNTIKFND